ncbi:DUF6503 family protein [Aquimarina sp. RZ0]|uniref:DUF6503 family protein n=1 Tax=Aquimarina sp. RZ0 TaxID=2607730 RepID=UPI0011F18B76|nr:DUF6503 family protein [Aquimarina sp. RZ0]KAA1243921.1 hypothetical protein F0000_18845 [Aquimarina sp. RZ0]
MNTRRCTTTTFCSCICIIISVLYSCSKKPVQEINGSTVLQKSINYHDPQHQWNTSMLYMHIQEPRIGNPYRYSIIKMNNQKESFELQRNRGKHIVTYSINKDGERSALLDGQKVKDTALITKYKLVPDRSIDYQKFYQLMWGLPMSLNEAVIYEFKKVSTADFNEQECYKIELELKEALFSKFWYVYIKRSNFQLVGVEIIFPDKPKEGERIYFEKQIVINRIRIPRIRHWYDYYTDEYSGSDIAIKKMKSHN